MWGKRGRRGQARDRVGELTVRGGGGDGILGVWVEAGLGWDGHGRAVEGGEQMQRDRVYGGSI